LQSLVDDVCTLLREAALIEYSHHWTDAGCWVDTGYSLLTALMAKVVVANPIGEEYDADWEDTGLVDEEWMRDMYARNWDNLTEWDDAVYLE
jgi:hypothetical protein